MQLYSKLARLRIEENVGGGAFCVGPTDLLDPRVVAVVPFACSEVLDLSYIMTPVEGPAVMGDPVELVFRIVLTIMV